MMSEYLPLHRFKAIYVVDLCSSLCDVARKKAIDKGWTNVHVIEDDACLFKPPTGLATLVTFSYSLSSMSWLNSKYFPSHHIHCAHVLITGSLCFSCPASKHGVTLSIGMHALKCILDCSAPTTSIHLPSASGDSSITSNLCTWHAHGVVVEVSAVCPKSASLLCAELGLGCAVIPPFHQAVDRAISYLDPIAGLMGVTDFYVSSKYDLPLRQMNWITRFFWRCAYICFSGSTPCSLVVFCSHNSSAMVSKMDYSGQGCCQWHHPHNRKDVVVGRQGDFRHGQHRHRPGAAAVPGPPAVAGLGDE